MANPELPSPPFITIPGINNFRDAGGYAVTGTSSRSVRQHYVYRCADPSLVTEEGAQKLRDLNVRTFYDLRSVPEIEKQKDRAPVMNVQGVQRVFVPAFKEQDYSPEKIAVRYANYAEGGPEGFTKAYADILANAGASYRTILLHIRDRPQDPFALHCTAGKDRTGVIIALILSIAGVEPDTIAREYALTDIGLAPLKPQFVAHLKESPALGGDMKKIEQMISARSENMLATLKMIDERYGGAEGYLKQECGLSEDDINRIRANLVADIDAAL